MAAASATGKGVRLSVLFFRRFHVIATHLSCQSGAQEDGQLNRPDKRWNYFKAIGWSGLHRPPNPIRQTELIFLPAASKLEAILRSFMLSSIISSVLSAVRWNYFSVVFTTTSI